MHAAIVARRFLRDPRHTGLIVPLWTHLTAAAGRLDPAFARLAAGRHARPTPRPSGLSVMDSLMGASA
jgi:hypothetical protein